MISWQLLNRWHVAVVQNARHGDIVIKKTMNINTKYTFGKVLGRGQFGVTHLAVHRKTGNEYAVKSIPKRKLKKQHDIDSLKREVTIMHLLSGHPNIVDFKKVYEDKENVHIVMELCSGGELFDHIVAQGMYCGCVGMFAMGVPSVEDLAVPCAYLAKQLVLQVESKFLLSFSDS